MLLIHQGDTPTPRSPEAWAWAQLSEDEQNAVYAAYKAINETPGGTSGLQLQAPETATTVRVQDGKTLTTDGPFARGASIVVVTEDEKRRDRARWAASGSSGRCRTSSVDARALVMLLLGAALDVLLRSPGAPSSSLLWPKAPSGPFKRRCPPSRERRAAADSNPGIKNDVAIRGPIGTLNVGWQFG